MAAIPEYLAGAARAPRPGAPWSDGSLVDPIPEAFDLRAFHDVALGNGKLPLAVLDTVVEDWIVTHGH